MAPARRALSRSPPIRRAASTPTSSTSKWSHTPAARSCYENFVKLAGFTGDWTMASYRDEAIRKIREQVGDKRVICGCPAASIPSVAAVLIHEAIGDQLTCVFVDHGLMRQNEAEEVVADVPRALQHPADPCRRGRTCSSGALEGVSDPRSSARPSASCSSTCSRNTRQIEGAEFLAQGTLYPDVIESVSSPAALGHDQSHHNVGGLPERMKMKLVEAARTVQGRGPRPGPRTGLPENSSAATLPRPGPAIRCPGEITREKLEILRKADAVYIDQIRKPGFGRRDLAGFCRAILPVKTVGVMGDGRTYDYACALRAVTRPTG